MSGVTSTGFETKTFVQIRAELEADLRSTFGAAIDVSPQSVFGQLIGIMAERMAEFWEAAEGIYSASYPDTAEGLQLDNLAAITGTVRRVASRSVGFVYATGTAGTALATGRIFSVAGAGSRFRTTAAATITALPAYQLATPYAAGARITNSGNIYERITAGTSAASGLGPTLTTPGVNITDNGIASAWRYIMAGTAVAVVPVESEELGAVQAYARTLTTIETPVAGLSAIVNADDAIAGALEESDAALRLRREQELRGSGNAARDSIRTKVMQVQGVLAVSVFENESASTVGGMPPHSVEVLVEGGAPLDIAAAILASKAAGIATHGNVSTFATDSTGVSRTIKFSRPETLPLYMRATIIYNPALYPVDGDARVAAALATHGDISLRTGVDVYASGFVPAVFAAVPGVLSATVTLGATANAAVALTHSVTVRQLADIDAGRVLVTSSPGAL